MQTSEKKHIRQIMSFFTCLFLVLTSLTRTDAADRSNNRTVKAGIFYFDGYHMKDQDGGLTGYGIEFLNLVSEYSHLNFEYTGYDRSWNDMLEMLESGEIDIVTSARKTKEREELFLFSLPIGRNNTILSIQADNKKLRKGDYRSYDGMTVGVVPGSSQNQSLVEFAEEKGFTYEEKGYSDTDELAKALQDGTVDAVLSSDLRRTRNEKTLDTIASDNFYAIVRKDDAEIIDEVNFAIEQMDISEGDWSNVMLYKYYGPVYSSGLTFNKREQAYIRDVAAGKKKITATAIGDRAPYSYVENGELKGIVVDYFDRIMGLAGLPYENVVPADRADYYDLEYSNSVDVVMDTRTSNDAVQNNKHAGFYTSPYISAGMAKVTRKGFTGEVSTVATAEAQGDVPLEQNLVGNALVVQYDTREEALQAVLDKEADAAYVYTYSAQMFVNNDITDSLQYSIMDEIRFDFQMYVRNTCDHELVTILNKCIQQMPDDELNQLIAEYTAYVPADMTLSQYLKVHPEVMAAGILLAVLAVGIIIYMILRAQWKERILDASEQSKRELEAQLAIVDALSRDYINVFSVDMEEDSLRVIKANGYAASVLKLKSNDQVPYDQVLQGYTQGCVHPDDRQYFMEALSLDRVRKKLEEAAEYTGSFHVLTDGELHNFQFTCVKLEEAGSQGDYVILTGFRNIDEMVRKEQEQKEVLAEALAEAQHANHAKTTFLNNMSHDIRTPMNAIIGFTSLAVSHIEMKEQVRSYLEKIMTSSKHLLSLINDVLDMSRIESGKVRIEEKEASLPEIMHDLKTIVQSEVKSKQLEFHIDTLDVTNETIICDKLRLNQVLLNILSNAMKYTKPGGSVSVRIVQTDDAPEGFASYRFHVSDTGIGMSQEFLKHLFEPFEREQTSTISGIQGTGLGLAITKNIVDMMNGTISVKSETGKGTEFVVGFQFRTVSGLETEEYYIEELAGRRALIADDDINTCMSVSKMLSVAGMRPDWTTQGKEAVVRTEFALEQQEPYGVYIIDWLMPDMNGVEIVRRIRKVIDKEAMIIILTAYDWTDIEEEAREAGVTAFCSKPVFYSELRSVLTASFTVPEEEANETPEEDLFTGKKILLVEDNEINQEIAKVILEEAGFVIDIANNGAEAVERMETAPADTYDMVLMDIQMPVMNGYEATEKIRLLDDPVKSSVPIVAMTANAFEEDKQMAAQAGMNGHIAKPIDVEKLMETLKNILKGTGTGWNMES